MGGKPVVAIEHLEDELSPWLLLEYRHASLILGKNMIEYTNVPRKYHRILSKYGAVHSGSVLEIYDHSKLLILDPASEKPLVRNDLDTVEAVVIGGILGDHPPKKRTHKLLSSKAPRAIRRNIGRGQYSIDGAVYVVYMVMNGYSLDEIHYVDGVKMEVKHDGITEEIILPFRYPLVNGNPLLAPGLKQLLEKGSLPVEIINELRDP